MVVPSARRVRTYDQRSCRNATSTPAVGSSRNATRGRGASALAISNRRFIPPGNHRVLVCALDPPRGGAGVCGWWGGKSAARRAPCPPPAAPGGHALVAHLKPQHLPRG